MTKEQKIWLGIFAGFLLVDMAMAFWKKKTMGPMLPIPVIIVDEFLKPVQVSLIGQFGPPDKPTFEPQENKGKE